MWLIEVSNTKQTNQQTILRQDRNQDLFTLSQYETKTKTFPHYSETRLKPRPSYTIQTQERNQDLHTLSRDKTKTKTFPHY